MLILLSSLWFWRWFLMIGVWASYTSQVLAPGGVVEVGHLVSEVFLMASGGTDTVRVDEKLINPGFEDGLLGYTGDAEVVGNYEMEGESIWPAEGGKMAFLAGSLFDTQSTLVFWVASEAGSLRMRLNIVGKSSELVSESQVSVMINGREHTRHTLRMSNPLMLNDGAWRQSGFFDVEFALFGESSPILVEVVNSKDPDLLIPDLHVLVDGMGTDLILGNNQTGFEIVQTGRTLPHKYYSVGGDYLEASSFSLPEGDHYLRYFAQDDMGRQAATKSARVRILTRSLAPISDLTVVHESSSASRVEFGYIRNTPLRAVVYGGEECTNNASMSAVQSRALDSVGFWEEIAVPRRECFRARVGDQYGNTSPWSSIVQ